MKILVSACLLGVNCRYDGGGALYEDILKTFPDYCLIPVCPEQLGGLPTPRMAAEISEGRVRTKDGRDVTEEYVKGAEETLKIARLFDCDHAVLKERSPSCGFGKIYDGTFSGKLIDGDGLTAKLLAENGIKVLGESRVIDLKKKEK